MAEPQKSGDKPLEKGDVVNSELMDAQKEADKETQAIADSHLYQGDDQMTEEEYLGYDPEKARENERKAIEADAAGDYEKARELRADKKPNVRRSTSVTTSSQRETTRERESKQPSQSRS